MIFKVAKFSVWFSGTHFHQTCYYHGEPSISPTILNLKFCLNMRVIIRECSSLLKKVAIQVQDFILFTQSVIPKSGGGGHLHWKMVKMCYAQALPFSIFLDAFISLISFFDFGYKVKLLRCKVYKKKMFPILPQFQSKKTVHETTFDNLGGTFWSTPPPTLLGPKYFTIIE